MNNLNIERILFQNNTYLPVIIETWVNDNSKLSHTLTNIVVEPFDYADLTSITGEWYINCNFSDDKQRSLWTQFYTDKNSNYIGSYYLGKFRNTPCMYGEYSWLEDDYFECLYFEGIMELRETVKK
jgi:hypothetical protein